MNLCRILSGMQSCSVPVVLLFCSSFHDAAAQIPAGVSREAGAARIDYTDLDRFAGVYRRLLSMSDTAALLDSVYIAGAGAGLRTYAGMYDLTAAALAAAIGRDPERYRETATSGPPAVRDIEPAVRRSFARLAELYPAALFPPVFYVVAQQRAGGAVQPTGILIAAEVYAGSFADLRPLIIHELIHYQQAAANVEAYQTANSLLARAIREGGADFVTELVTGRHINPTAHAYGAEHEWDLWRAFRCEMANTETGDWFFRTPDRAGWPRDLGYFIGYRIVAHHYAQRPDPVRALADVITRVADAEALLTESGYEDALARRTGRSFPSCDA